MRVSGFLAAAAIAAIAPSFRPAAAAPDRVETVLLPDASGPARLALAAWPERGWRVRQSGLVAEVFFPGEFWDISLPDLAAGWAGGALETVSAEPGDAGTTLILRLGCDCRLALAGDGETRLAIDIVGAELAAGPLLRGLGPAPAFAPFPPRRNPGGFLPDRPETAVAPAVIDPEPASAGDARQAAAIAAARRRLVEQLERAAAAGIIELEPDHGAGATASSGPGSGEPSDVGDAGRAAGPADRDAGSREAAAAGAGAAPQKGALPEAGGSQPSAGPGSAGRGAGDAAPSRAAPGHRDEAVPEAGDRHDVASAPGPAPGAASTRPGRDVRAAPEDAVPEAAARPGPAPRCWPDSAFALPDATRGAQAVAAIAGLRSGLVGEFDRPASGAALELARLYIAHDLGEEALQVLEDFAPEAAQTPLLAAMARIAGGVPLPHGDTLAGAGCGGLQALWRADALARTGEAEAALASLAGAGRSLEAQPAGRRTGLAARLGLAALDAGAVAQAHDLAALARRGVLAGAAPPSTLLLLEARLARAGGRPAEALEILRRLRRDPGPDGEDALLLIAEMVRGGEAGGAAPARDLARLRLDLGAMALLHRGEPRGRQALEAELALTDGSLGRRAALDLLEEIRLAGLLDDAAHAAELRSLGAAPPAPDDPAGIGALALDHAVAPGRYAGAMSDPAFRAALARSYVAIGLPGRGADLLAPEDLANPGLSAELAEALLHAGRNEEALRLWEGMPHGADRDRLAPGMLAAQGRPAAALAALGAAATPAERARLAWAAGDWGTAETALAELAGPAESGAGGSAGSAAALRLRQAMARTRAGTALQAPFDPTPEGVARLLEALETEARDIREILSDG